jgi:enoyl-CoA hydratase/carnithine racemase
MITTFLENRILTIVFDRAQKKNALTSDMYRAANTALLESAENSEIRAVLFKGAGGDFTSGNDMAAFLEMTPEATPPVLTFLLTLAKYPKPVIAAVSGLAVGIGTTMLAHCDYVVAGENARFKMPFVDLGLCPEGGSSFFFPNFMGHSLAAELLILGDFFGSKKAEKVGLVNEVIAVEGVETKALEIARRFAIKPPTAVRNAKAMLKADYHDKLDGLLTREIDQLIVMIHSPECKEALSAFAQKRKPDFSGF